MGTRVVIPAVDMRALGFRGCAVAVVIAFVSFVVAIWNAQQEREAKAKRAAEAAAIEKAAAQARANAEASQRPQSANSSDGLAELADRVFRKARRRAPDVDHLILSGDVSPWFDLMSGEHRNDGNMVACSGRGKAYVLMDVNRIEILDCPLGDAAVQQRYATGARKVRVENLEQERIALRIWYVPNEEFYGKPQGNPVSPCPPFRT